jgi:L-amino acid N-acyltransferase YncA
MTGPGMPELTVRPATAADIPAITAIYADAVARGTASFELSPPDEAEMARRMSELLGKGFPYFAADLEGQLAGHAYAGPYRARPAYRFTVEDSVYVAPQMHGRGAGHALLTALVTESEARGFRQMIAVIGGSGQTASIALHAAAGFYVVGTLPNVGFKFDRWLDAVLMQRPLGKGATAPP